MTQSVPFLFAAVHKGPYLSIQPVEEELGPDQVAYLVEGVTKEERVRNASPYMDMGRVEAKWGCLEAFLEDMQVEAVIRSSSEDVLERNPEDLASVAARNVGVPVFVVEDFPGNYWAKPGERLDGLFVEDDALIELHSSRGVDPHVIYSTGNPRYNVLRSLDTRRAKLETRRVLGLAGEPTVLWAGQPDGDSSYLALERLLHHLGEHQVTLLFRAHPRDRKYTCGRYGELLGRASMKVLDVSNYSDVLGLYCSSDLVVTQFSSAGVEASYLGVPALFVLFDDLGKAYLRSFKGYETLPWSKDGCSFLIEREEEVKDVLEQALFDRSSREEVCASFQRHFGSRKDSAQGIADRIRSTVGKSI